MPEFTLTVNLAGGGGGEVECEAEGGAEPCAHEAGYPAGTELTLVPIVDEESDFAGFSAGSGSAAGCAGASPCTFTIEADSSITATFEPVPEHSLEINLAGSGEGEVACRVAGEEEYYPCEDTYPDKTRLTLRQFAETESSRSGGFSAGTGSAAECTGTACTFTITEDSSVTATFESKLFTLKASKEGTGTGTWVCEREEGPEPCAAKYPYGTEVTLIAKADPDSAVAGWSGECHRIAGVECEVEMDVNRKVTVTFDSTAEYTLAVEVVGTGSGTVTGLPGSIDCGSVCSDVFRAGTEVTLTATPASGSSFGGWTGGGCTAAGGCTVTMNRAKTVKATFETDRSSPPPLTQEGGSGQGGAARVGSVTAPVGTARAAGSALVRNGKASLTLSCSGGPCRGSFKLKGRVRKGQKKNLVIGGASFSLGAGASTTREVRLSAAAADVLGRDRALQAKVTGTDIAPSTVRLKLANRAKKRR